MATKQVSQTNLTPTYGNIAKRDVLATFDKATELQAIFESPAFADARAYLGTSNNDFSGVGATADVQAQLGVLRTLSLFAAEKTIAGTGIPFQNRLLRDPVTGNRVFFTGGSDPTKQAVLISAPGGQSGWLMHDGEMVRFQNGEGTLRLVTGPDGRLHLQFEFVDDISNTTRRRTAASRLRWRAHMKHLSRWLDIDRQIWKFIDEWNISNSSALLRSKVAGPQ